jgi:proton-dependent oligopeptide transporter, POT family
MLFGLAQYVLGKRRLQPALDRIAGRPRATPGPASGAPAPESAAGALGFTRAEWGRIGVIGILIAAATLFWAGYEQAGSTLNLFADRYTRLEIWGFGFPSSWFQSVQPFFVIVLAPVFAWVWLKLGPHEPSVLGKFAFGLFFMGLAFLVLVPAGLLAQSGEATRVSPMWLIVAYFLSELGELALSPVGLSAVTKLSPSRIVGLMMGFWFLALAFGNKLAGSAAGLIGGMPLESLFGIMAAVLIAGAIATLILAGPIRRVVGEAR